MVLDRTRDAMEHGSFGDLPDALRPGDLLVMNNTRVLPARLFGKKETGGNVEILLIPSWNGGMGEWEVLIKNARKVKDGTRLRFGRETHGTLKEVKGGRGKILFSGEKTVSDLLQTYGHIPLPPYIHRKDEPLDRDRYQTVIAEKDGSIAAPTAGLHFTRSILRILSEKGVKVASITLHVGPGTFTPVKAEEVEEHRMDKEWVEIPEETAVEIEEAKGRGGRVIAVGTTTVRALESFTDQEGRTRPGKAYVTLFIRPPHRFRAIDGLVTNFHLPRSTLILLVSAFAGGGLIRRAYQEAVKMKYRFYSYGDAMLIL